MHMTEGAHGCSSLLLDVFLISNSLKVSTQKVMKMIWNWRISHEKQFPGKAVRKSHSKIVLSFSELWVWWMLLKPGNSKFEFKTSWARHYVSERHKTLNWNYKNSK